jgi:hypothetical protein
LTTSLSSRTINSEQKANIYPPQSQSGPDVP